MPIQKSSQVKDTFGTPEEGSEILLRSSLVSVISRARFKVQGTLKLGRFPVMHDTLSTASLPGFSSAFTHTISFCFGPCPAPFVSVNGPIAPATDDEFSPFFSAVGQPAVTAALPGEGFSGSAAPAPPFATTRRQTM